MAAQVISLAQRMRAPASRDWSRQELAEFYRVESALLQAGLDLETERGLSDEGDPWFVFCRVDTGEVFIHFARADGWYVVDGAAMGAPSRGRDFGALVRDLIGRHPLSDARRPGSNVLMHPAALLIALVGAAFFHSGRAKAAEVAHHVGADAPGADRDSRRGLVLGGAAAPLASTGEPSRTVALDATEVAAVLTGVAIGLREIAFATAAAAAPAVDPLAAPSAMAAAPAARDPADRSTRSLSADMLGALSASQARAALTVIAVVHDLVRLAPASSGSEANGAGVIVAVTTSGFPVRADAAAPTAAAPQAGAEHAPLLLVHLAAGPLPQIEALAVVAADGALARVSPDRVFHVDQISSFLAEVINHGEIVPPAGYGGGSGGGGSGGGGSDAGGPGGASPATDPTPDHTTAPLDDAHAHAPVVKPAADTHDSAAVAPPPAATDDAAQIPSAPAAPSTPTPAPPPLQAAVPAPPAPLPEHVAAPAHPAYIDTAVDAFVTEVTNVQVVISGHDVVFYDPQILSTLAAGETLDSITWRLEDGSSVSLVGTASELHAFHGLG